MRNRGFIIGFFVVGLFFFTMALPWFERESSTLENRTLMTMSEIDTDFFETKFQSDVETLLSDQFLFRNFVVRGTKKLEMVLGDLVSFIFPDVTPTQLTPKSDEINEIGESGYLIYDPLFEDEDKLKSLDMRVYNLNEKVATIDVPFYIYKIKSAEETAWFETSYPSYGQSYLSRYQNSISSGIHFREYPMYSLEEYQKRFFKTDHHWNITGAYFGYTDLIKWLSSDFDLGEPVMNQGTFCFDTPYLGSLAKKLSLAVDGETFCDITYDHKDFTITIDETPVSEYGHREQKLSDIDDSTYLYDHYFGNNYYEIIYKQEEKDLKALFIVDSFSNPINDLIATHFNETYFIDLRAKPEGEQFILSDYTREHDIDLVVTMLYYDTLYFHGYYFFD